MPPPLIGVALSDDAVCLQGSYRSWKSLKVMEFKVEIFHVWKIMENDVRYRKVKVMENVTANLEN